MPAIYTIHKNTSATTPDLELRVSPPCVESFKQVFSIFITVLSSQNHLSNDSEQHLKGVNLSLWPKSEILENVLLPEDNNARLTFWEIRNNSSQLAENFIHV